MTPTTDRTLSGHCYRNKCNDCGMPDACECGCHKPAEVTPLTTEEAAAFRQLMDDWQRNVATIESHGYTHAEAVQIVADSLSCRMGVSRVDMSAA